MKGRINIEELNSLINLKNLSIEDNEIEGFKSFNGGEELLNMSNLEYLDIGINYFGNDVLSSLRGLSSLKTLWMDGNQLNGFFDLKGSNLTNLRELYLDHSSVHENLLQSLEALPSLETLSMQDCELSGIIPVNQGICKLKHLQMLDISHNDLSGNLLLCLANLTSLRQLDLSFNHFIGNFSSSPLGGLTNLEHLSLSNNLFQIPISLSPFFNHSKLKYIESRGNKIFAETDDQYLNPRFQLESFVLSDGGYHGVFPKFLYHQHNLQVVDLSHNQMREGFPSWLLQNNTKLEELYLINNSLSGFLYELQLDGNQFTGSIPHSLSNSSFLQVLDLRHNNLYGRIPRWLGNMHFLRVLDLSMNNISGSLPSNFCPSNIQEIFLSRSGLQGSLEDAFYGCSELIVLDLGHNNMTGSIPSWIGKFSQLRYLILGHNYIDGEIPVQLCNLKQLSLLDLSHNHLLGPILPCLRSTSNRTRKQGDSYTAPAPPVPTNEPLEFTTKSTSYSYQGRMLSYISGIDLSCNHLTGQIPIEIGYLNEIQVLNLSHNSLTGKIPASFSNLRQIESLDLSYNNLEGNIPPQLTELTFLEVFNVSYNNLSGRTLDKVAQFGTFDESSYRGNPFLCGWPLPRNCTEMVSPPSKSRTSIENEESNGFMDMGVFYISFGVAYSVVLLTIAAVLYINPYWRRVWFYFIEVSIENCYYFIIDNLAVLSKFRFCILRR
uniref:Uncharacterized protein n=1 Tax=Manihot esculenta TaxID=3983 RepID=A0A2C9WAB1_MANES